MEHPLQPVADLLERVQDMLDPECKVQSGISWGHSVAVRLIERKNLPRVTKQMLFRHLIRDVHDAMDDVSRHWRQLWPESKRLTRLRALDILEDACQLLDLLEVA